MPPIVEKAFPHHPRPSTSRLQACEARSPRLPSPTDISSSPPLTPLLSSSPLFFPYTALSLTSPPLLSPSRYSLPFSPPLPSPLTCPLFPFSHSLPLPSPSTPISNPSTLLSSPPLLSPHSYSVRFQGSKLGRGCSIPLPEMRGISLSQLRALAGHVTRRCRNEKWVDVRKVASRSPRDGKVEGEVHG